MLWRIALLCFSYKGQFVQVQRTDRLLFGTVFNCSVRFCISRFAEEVAAGKLFPFVANLSPFLVDLLNPYFLGGVDDMAAWTRHIWRDFVHMLEHGVQ